MKPWNELKLQYDIENKMYFQWLQLKYAIPNKWEISIKLSSVNVNDLVQDHHLIKGARILAPTKLASKDLFSILMSKCTKISHLQVSTLRNSFLILNVIGIIFIFYHVNNYQHIFKLFPV